MNHDLEKVQSIIAGLRQSAYWTALGKVRNADDAEDIAGTAIFRCYRRASKFDTHRWGDELYKGLYFWVKKAAERASIDFIRKRNRERDKTVSLSDIVYNEDGESRLRYKEPSYMPDEFALIRLRESLSELLQTSDEMGIDFDERWWGVDRKTRVAFRPRVSEALTQMELDLREHE